jgi:gliding motility-associated-like protein
LNKTVLHIIFLFLISKASFGQENLVPNGSFEEYNWCPDYDNGFYITACKNWTMPTTGTSDYFNACCSTSTNSIVQFGVPQNYAGFQYARTGNAYVGLLYSESMNLLTDDHISYSEYIQVKLKSKLKTGKSYQLKFYVSNNSNYFCSNTIGAYLSPDEISLMSDTLFNISNHFQSDLSQFFCDSTKWFEQKYNFIASGNEQYLTIGVFTKLYDSKTIQGGIVQNNFSNQYLYIDDVSIIDTDLKIPNVITANNDGINDLLILLNIPEGYTFEILNRWGSIIFKTSSPNIEFWEGKTNGLSCIEGIYYYILKDKIGNKQTGFIHLLR